MSSWDDDKIEILRENWGKMTASALAEKIGGVTRNAVIGKAHRLNLSAKIKKRSSISFKNNTEKVIDLSITPNRPDCLGVRGVARDLAAAGVGKLKNISNMKIKNSGHQKIKVSLQKIKIKVVPYSVVV